MTRAASELLTNVSEDDPKIFMKPAVKIHPEMARHSLPFIFLITDGAVQNEVWREQI